MDFNKFLGSRDDDYQSSLYSDYSRNISEDLRAAMEEDKKAEFDPDAIRIARTLTASNHVDEENPMSFLKVDDPNEIYDDKTPKMPYDYRGPIEADMGWNHSKVENEIDENKKTEKELKDERKQMRLMMEDLNEKFPPPQRAPVQTLSTNKSAVNMARLLFNLGVKRWFLPLLLINKDLDGVDPYSANLTLEQQEAIANEIQDNLIYYCREVVRIPAAGSPRGVQMRMHIGAFTSIYLTANDVTYYLEQPRQTYKSGTDNAIMGWCWNFACRGSNMALFANNVTKAKDNLLNVKEILELLPDYLQFFRYKSTQDKDGIISIQDCNDYAKGVEIHHKLWNNKIYAGTTGQTKENAMKTGRGKSLVKIGFDEIGFSKYNWFAYGSAQPAHEEAAANAEKSGIPHNITMTSTPPDATTKEGEWLHKLLFEDAVRFSLKIFDLSKEEIFKYMAANGKKDIIFCSFAYNELGFTQEWLIQRLRKLDRDMFDVEVMLKWKRILNRSPFSRRALELIEIYAKNSKARELILNNKDVFIVHEDFDKCRLKRIVVGVDIAGGGGNHNDYSTMVGIDPTTTKILFTFRTNEADTEVFARIIIDFYRQYIPNAVLVVERNGIGRGVVDKLKYCEDIVDNLYYQSETIDEGFYINSKDAGVKKSKYGLDMTHTVREIMYKEILNQRVNRYKTYFNSVDLVRELMSVTITASGRYDHLPGYHDDLLMAYMMALYVLFKDMDMDQKFAIHVPAVLDDEAMAYNKLDSYVKKESSIAKLTKEQQMKEFIKANALNKGELFGFKTLEDESYRRDVETVKYNKSLEALSNADEVDDNPDAEITVSSGDMPIFGNGRRVNRLMPRGIKKPF